MILYFKLSLGTNNGINKVPIYNVMNRYMFLLLTQKALYVAM